MRERLKELKDVKFHVFGHIHEGYGVTTDKDIEGVTFINASTVDLRYKVSNKPIMFYVEGRGREHCDVDRVWNDAPKLEEEQKENVSFEPVEKGQSAVSEQNDDENVANDQVDDEQESNVPDSAEKEKATAVDTEMSDDIEK